jgi:hypothetical protein
MSKLRASISYQHRIDEAKAIQQQQTRENIAEPIVFDDEENNEENNENNDEHNDENNEEEDNESQASSNWNGLINMWEQLLLQEKEAEEQAENDLEDNYDIEIDDFLLDRTHPSLDNDAKWNIEEIFVYNLGAPFYTNEDISN